MKRILALIVCLLSAQMMMAQTTELQAKRVRALDSVFINGRWVKSVGIDTALSGTNRDIVSIEAVRLHVANRMAGVASLYTTKNQFLDSINALKLLIGDGGSLDWTSGYPTYDLRYARIARLTDTAAAIWGRVQSTYQVAQANYSTTFALLNDGRDSIQNRYTKAQSDARYLQSFTETDPTVYAWAKAATKPAYAVAEISGLQTALDGKQNVLGFTPVPETRTINGAPLSANIVISKGDIGLGNLPNVDATNPANISQSSSFRFVTDTEKSTWNAKQNALGYTPENLANKGIANGYAALGSDSKILAYQLPQVAINQTFTVNSQSAMLALSANQGDIAVRTDQNKAYILAFTGASTLANWIALPGVSNEADPVFTASPAFGVTGTNISNWNSAFGWGNHAGLYRPVSWVPSWTDVTGRPTALSQFTNDAGFITGINSSMVTTALGFTPYNATNPAGFITATTNALTNYYTISQSDARYPLTNGTGASGTWSINISGNAATATTATNWSGSSSLGSYAYRSSGLAELGGSTFIGSVIFGSQFRSKNEAGFLLRNNDDNATLGGFVRESWWFGNTNNNPTIFAETGLGINLVVGGLINRGLFLASTGEAMFSSTIRATSTGVDGTYQDAFIAQYSANNNETNAIQTAVSSTASGSGFRFQASNGGGSSARTTVLTLVRDGATFNASVTAASFIRSGGTSSQFLKADGSVDGTSYYPNSNPSGFITASALSGYLPLGGGTLTGSLTVSVNSGITVGANQRALIRQTTGGDAEIGAATGGYLYLLNNGSNALSFGASNAATFPNTVSATRFFATSDIRLKIVFSEFKSADGINTILYSFKNEFSPAWGYNAQQVQKEMSFAVTQGDDGYLRVDYQQVHTYKIMLLEKRIAELEKLKEHTAHLAASLMDLRAQIIELKTPKK